MADATRRELLKSAVFAGAAGLLVPAAFARQDTPAASARRRALRLAHLTDTHIQPELRADEGVRACLKHVQSLPDAPQLVLTGGDLIMDGFAATRDRTKLQWELWLKVLKGECALPVEHCLGNHDIWGWHKGKAGATGSEPDYGKKWAVETLGLPGPYRSFDRAGWHFIVLDSVASDGADGYIGRLDDEQFDWLRADLQKTPPATPVLVVSHIPILTATVFYAGRDEEPKDGWELGRGIMHVDMRRIVSLFRKHPNVKLCLSGHIHQLDRIEYQGVTYICDGAVSGRWWKGEHVGCPEGYGVVDLFDDGSFEHRYTRYGWKAEA